MDSRPVAFHGTTGRRVAWLCLLQKPTTSAAAVRSPLTGTHFNGVFDSDLHVQASDTKCNNMAPFNEPQPIVQGLKEKIETLAAHGMLLL